MKNIKFLSIAFIFLTAGSLDAANKTEDVFSSLSVVEKFTKDNEEYPPMDNRRFFKPDYTSFYQSEVPGFWGRLKNKIFSFLGLKAKHSWTALDFKKLLIKVTNLRKNKGYDREHVLKFTPKVGSKIVVWGDIQGALHSLTRDLKKLKELNIVNDDLKIVKPDYYFVFNGDLVSRSPYNMETLTLALRILEENPEQAFYIRGNHEIRNYWMGYGLKRELKIRAKHLSRERIPLKKEVNDFFDTLPLSLFLGMEPKRTSDFVQITHMLGDSMAKLDPNNFSGFLRTRSEDPSSLSMFKFDTPAFSEEPIRVRGMIVGQSREFTYEENEGLLLLSAIRGATAWTLLSSPTLAYQGAFDFKHDAFCIITVGKAPDAWTITLYNQNVKKMDGFKTETHEFLSGERIV